MKRTFFWISLVATCLWIALIFGNSMQNGEASGAASGSVTEWVNQAIHSVIPSLNISEFFLRKAAHVSEFAILAGLFCTDLALLLSLFQSPSFSRLTWVFTALPASMLIAATDEFIQRFSEGRVSTVTDVWIDTAGAAFACLLFYGILCLIYLRRQKNTKEALAE